MSGLGVHAQSFRQYRGFELLPGGDYLRELGWCASDHGNRLSGIHTSLLSVVCGQTFSALGGQVWHVLSQCLFSLGATLRFCADWSKTGPSSLDALKVGQCGARIARGRISSRLKKGKLLE